MSGVELRDARVARKWNQADVARKLGVSQAYVSLLESSRRPIPDRLARKVVSVLALPASTLPVSSESTPLHAEDAARALGALGYTAFAHLRQSRKVNPAELLLRTLRSPNVEARLVEALPWLLVNHPKVDWQWLLREAKVNDLQNRLGFVVTVACGVADREGKSDAAEVLRHWERVLENSRLAKEDAFAQDVLTHAERTWLRSNRSKEAARWNLLTNLSAETVASTL